MVKRGKMSSKQTEQHLQRPCGRRQHDTCYELKGWCGFGDRAIGGILKKQTGDIDRRQTGGTLWAMFVSYSKYDGKPWKVFKSLGAICLLKKITGNVERGLEKTNKEDVTLVRRGIIVAWT